MLARVGSVAYERLYRPSVEKVWGLAPSRLSRSIARQRLSTSSPWSAVVGALRPGPAARTFLYPERGAAAIIASLMRECERLGVPVRYGAPVDRAALDALPHERVIHTGPLRAMARAEGLAHRGLYLVHIALPPRTLDGTDTWYVPDARYWFGRVSQPARFSPRLATRAADVLAVEIPEGRWGEERDFTRALSTVMEQLRDAGGRSRRRGAPRRAADVGARRVPDVHPRVDHPLAACARRGARARARDARGAAQDAQGDV